jgi:hypothetical protein
MLAFQGTILVDVNKNDKLRINGIFNSSKVGIVNVILYLSIWQFEHAT